MKDALGRKTTVPNTSADLVKELRVPSDADDSAIQEALMRLFNAQTRYQTESVAVEGQATRGKRSVTDSYQALKASDSVSDQFSPIQPESESKTSRSVQFKAEVSVSRSSQSNSKCTLAISRININIDNSLMERIYLLLKKEVLYKEILEEMESTRKNELIWGQEKYKFQKMLFMIHVTGQPNEVQYCRVAVPDELEVKSLLASELYSAPYSAHPGVRRTIGKAKDYFFWKSMVGYIKQFVESCLTCQLEKIDHTLRRGVSSPWPYRRSNGKKLASTSSRICPPLEAQRTPLWQQRIVQPRWCTWSHLGKAHRSRRSCTIVLEACGETTRSPSGHPHRLGCTVCR